MLTPDPRQVAYDAVYQLLRRSARSTDNNVRVWQCVHAALNAAGVGGPVDPWTGQRLEASDVDT